MRYVGRVTHRVSLSKKERVELTWYESYLMHDICVNREIGKNYQPMKLLVSEEPVQKWPLPSLTVQFEFQAMSSKFILYHV